jgi:hypothetical protein
VRQFRAAALPQHHGVIAVQRKALGRVREPKLRRGVDGLLRGGRPGVRHQDIASHQLVAKLGVQIGAQQRLLRDGFALRAAQAGVVRRIV